jgi:hypothetical protein
LDDDRHAHARRAQHQELTRYGRARRLHRFCSSSGGAFMQAGRAMLLLLLSTALPLGCNQNDVDDTRTSTSLGGPLSDAQIIGALATANQASIDQARVALQQGAVNASVRALAEQIMGDDTQQILRLSLVASPLGSPETNVLLQGIIDSTQRLAAVAPNTTAVDATFLCEELAQGAQTLALIDTRLLPEAADDAAMTAVVEQARAFFVAQDEQTQALATKLGVRCPSNS